MVTRNRLSLVVKNDTVIDMTPKAAPTGTYAHFIRVNRFAFAPIDIATKRTKKQADAERAITDTIKYLGWMSLKDSDHNGTAKDVSQAQERRAAADRLIASGTVVLLGSWSNGIAVGPGLGFTTATNEPEAIAPVKVKKARKATPAQVAALVTARRTIHFVPAATTPETTDPDSTPGASCEWTPRDMIPGVACVWAPAPVYGPAYVAKPRVRVTLATMQACSPRWMPAQIERPVQPVTAPPTAIYTPAVGDTIAITYQHERMTTDRVVTVQRVSPDGKAFRGYDRTYDRVRNYDMARVVTIRRIGGEGSEVAAG